MSVPEEPLPVSQIPNLVSREARARLVAEALMSVQLQLLRVSLDQTVNDARDDDPAAGMPLGPNGEVTTYSARRQALRDAQGRLAGMHGDVWDLVEGFAPERQEGIEEGVA